MTTKHFDYIAQKIAAAKDRVDKLAVGLGHHGIEGEIRELAAKECIEPFLTQSYRCGTGKVIDSLQNISSQIDLLVYHRKIAPPILFSPELGLFPVECVRYVFEIKAKLTAGEIKDANEKFESIRGLKSFPKKQKDGGIEGGIRPSTVLLAFASDISGSELERYLKYSDNRNPQCTVLCVLGKGYWFYDHEKKSWFGIEVAGAPPYVEFCGFITGFMNSLATDELTFRPFSPGHYVNVMGKPLEPIPLKFVLRTGD